MAFAIVADLPLGTYYGAGHDGAPEPMPSVARLHAALLCAAGFGPRAVLAGDALEACQDDLAALRWLEQNPPDGVKIPALAVSIAHSIAYRDDGTIHRSKSVASIKKLAKQPGGGTAVDGQFAWVWGQEPPSRVRSALEQICSDVGYLGTTESPVRLEAILSPEIEIDADLDEQADMFSAGMTTVPRPLPGRTDELTVAHKAATGEPPSVARDRTKTNEVSLSPVPPRRAVAPARYRRRGLRTANVPWSTAIVLPLDRVIDRKWRVAWAVAAHRALVQLIGYGAPPLVTGEYPPGSVRPANRLALHLLGPEMGHVPVPLRDRNGPRSALLILEPADADAGHLEALRRGLSGLTTLRGPGGVSVRVDQEQMAVFGGAEFWQPPAPGYVRHWETVPAAVPDTRGYAGWTFADAVHLSLGFVWKQHLQQVRGRGEERDRSLIDAICGFDVAIQQLQPLRTADVDRYVHKINRDAVVRPYRAVLTLGSLGGNGVVQALGQSRHLGGGLLVPHDVPEHSVAAPIVDVHLRGQHAAR